MSYTKSFTVNNVGNDEEVRAVTTCTRIVFGEAEDVANYPTVDWLWKGTVGTDYVSRYRGSKMVFESPKGKHFLAGELIANVKTASGSSTFNQEEY